MSADPPQRRPIAIPVGEMVLSWAAMVIGSAVAAWLIEERTPRSMALGALLLIPGVLLAIASLRALGRGTFMVSTGPFRWVRHPYYLAILVMLLGAIIALQAWAVLVLYIPVIRLTLERARREEHNLLLRFEGAYAEYQRHVPFLLPLGPPLPREGLAAAIATGLGLDEQGSQERS